MLEGPPLENCRLLARLAPKDHGQVRCLYLVAVVDVDDVVGILITTSRYPFGAPREQQIELAKRLTSRIAGNFKRTQDLKRQEHELQTTQDILELRAVTDRQFDNPLTMVQEFLDRLLEKSGGDRATLYLSKRNGGISGNALVS